ncbi:DUF6252 family protein [Mucilaginibacter sp. UR6-11]|uniref:DUF6252 family protein n=1 Tax=Mucilaginibacter sp. UR6-11 TaxID=1435644 RepID=UPI001E5E1804|nr:DUF6252 family protein [Mucilaginibacter sp. UR6-11]MCC8425348.1 DUF6252 family protein [Mucilaginibacter sp. UR6-11]
MKNNFLITLLICAVFFISPSCKKKNVSPLSKLPAATQTGANTFGCLINGAAFTPHRRFFLNSDVQANYIYYNGEYYLTIAASNDSDDKNLISVDLGTTKLPIIEGQTLNLARYNITGEAFGRLAYIPTLGNINEYTTTSVSSGQLHITKFDQNRQIISATFSFDALNSSGETAHITDGRFDMKYTQ